MAADLRAPRASVLVCTMPRSGSWLLSEGLLRAGVAGRPEEYLRPDWWERFEETGLLPVQHRLHQQQAWAPAPPAAQPAPPERRTVHTFLDAVRRVGSTDNGVFGCKAHWFQVENMLERLRRSGPHDAEPALHDVFPAPTYVRLVRGDKLRQAISWQRAIADNVWWSMRPRGSRSVTGTPYDANRLEQLADLLEDGERGWDAYFARWGIDPVPLTYEELAADYAGSLRRVLVAAGLWSPRVRLDPPRLQRQADAVTERWRHRYIRTSRRETDMRTSVIITDNFYANPQAVRDYAVKQDYYYPYQSRADVDAGRSRVTWMTSSFRPAAACPFKSSLELVARLESITGDVIDYDHWTSDFPLTAEGRPQPDLGHRPRSCLWNCSFHVKPDTGQQLGDGVHNHVVDAWNAVGESGWAGLLYLTPDAPLRGGLKLWRNVDSARDYDWMTPKEQWELIDDLGNVPNRLLLCRGSLPHSGARGWGTGVSDGRLYQTFFFKVRSRTVTDGVLAPV